MEPIRVYRFRSKWGSKTVLSKHYLPLDMIEALGATPCLIDWKEIRALPDQQASDIFKHELHGPPAPFDD